jgi:uncharacterized phiE125 gp8 family phage protein
MLKITTAATAFPVSLAEIKEHCRVDFTDHDDRLTAYLQAATKYAEGLTLQVFAPTTYEERWPDFPAIERRNLAIGPVRDVAAVRYIDENGTLQTLAEENWSFETTPDGAFVWFTDAFSAPSLDDDEPYPVRVEFTAGFNDPGQTGTTGTEDWLDCPLGVVQAIKMTVAFWYETPTTAGAPNLNEYPHAAKALLEQHRVWR